MKNTVGFLGIIALAALVGLSACDTGSGGGGAPGGGGTPGGGGGGAGAHPGATLNLSGQVWIEDTDQHLTGDRDVFARSWVPGGMVDFGGEGAITAGQLSFSIGTPAVLTNAAEFLGEEIGGLYSDFSVVPAGAMGAMIQSLSASTSGPFGGTTSLSRNLFSGGTTSVFEQVIFVYVDRNVTLTGGGGTFTEDGETYTVGNLNLGLRTGWNAVLSTGSFSGSNIHSAHSLANPNHLRWQIGS